jgi:hypothetical protein
LAYVIAAHVAISKYAAIQSMQQLQMQTFPADHAKPNATNG